MSYELRDHTADVAVEAEGRSFDAVAAAVADGLAAAMCDDVPPEGERFDVRVDAESRAALLFDYLDDLIYQRDVRGVLPVDNDVEIAEQDGGFELTGSARGVPLSAVSAREIKAVTYSEMEIAETAAGWRAYVVFDV